MLVSAHTGSHPDKGPLNGRVCVCVCVCVVVESSRVYLQPIRGVEGSDYINASFIDVRSCVTLYYF